MEGFLVAKTPTQTPTQTSPTPRWAEPQEVGEYLGLCERTIRMMLSDGRLVGYRLGGHRILIDLNEVDAAVRMQPYRGEL